MEPKEISSLFKLIETGKKENIELAFLLAKSQQLDWNKRLQEHYTSLIQLLKMGGKKVRFSNLTKNNLFTFIQLCEQITFLNIRYQEVTTIPNTIYLLKNLEELRIQESNLSNITNEIGQLTQLQEISFFDNNITHLPSSIQSLTQLKKLNLSLNPLSSLPLHGLSLLPKLHFLDIEGTNLKMEKEDLYHYLPNSVTILI